MLKPYQALLALLSVVFALFLLWPKAPELADMQVRAGSARDAIPTLERLVRQAPGDARARKKLGQAYELANQRDRALALVEQDASHRALSSQERARGLALALAIGDPARALRLLMESHQDPNAIDPQAGVKLALQSNNQVAARRFQAAYVARHPKDLAGLVALRDFDLGSHDLLGAIAVQRQALAVDPLPAQSEKLVTLLLQANSPRTALAELERHPDVNHLQAWHQRAAQLAAWGKQPLAALPHMQALYQGAPTLALGRQLLAALVAAHQPGALPFARKLAGAHPQDARLQADLRSLMLAAGDVTGVLAAFQVDVLARPVDATAHAALVGFALGQSRRSVALGELKRWTQRRPTDATAMHQLAQVLVWDGQREASQAAYAQLFRRFPRAISPATERIWRNEWLSVSSPADDVGSLALGNLQRLAASDPAGLPLRRRLAEAYRTLGQSGRAVAEQQALASRRGATREDAMRVVTWLIWDRRRDEALVALKALDARSPLAPSVLQDGAYWAAQSENWHLTAYFFGRAARARARDPHGWELFARAEELAGNPAAAVSAWQKRLALGGAGPYERLTTVGLLSRLHRPAEALAVLQHEGIARASVDEAREAAYLALALKRPVIEAAALRQVLARAPRDIPARLSLAELLERDGRPARAEALYAEALALAPDDLELLASVAARQFYAGRQAEARPLIARLERQNDLSASALRLLADATQASNPRAAAAYLDRLNASGHGDAETFFRRGELARGAHDEARARAAYERAIAIPGQTPRAFGPDEARAASLDRLGRSDEALAAYETLAVRFPDQALPQIAIARHFLEAKRLGAARVALERARAIAPRAFETRVLAAELLQAEGRDVEALPLLAALRRERPSATYLLFEEASLRHQRGEFRQARDLVRSALAVPTRDESIQALYRELRDEGTSHVSPFARTEQGSQLSRTAIGTLASARVGDQGRLSLDAARLSWGANALPQDEAGLGAEWRAGAVQADGRVALANRGGRVQEPLGRASLGLEHAGLRAKASAEESRWDETDLAAVQNGRERKLAGDVSWSPDPRLVLHGLAEVGQLRLEGGAIGPSNTIVAETALKLDGASPWTLYYQFRHRGWDAVVGALAGLPDGTEVHSALIGYARREGPWRFELQPGYSLDARSGQGAPTAAATLGFEFQPDAELVLSGAYSGRSFNQASAGTYERLDLQGAWRF